MDTQLNVAGTNEQRDADIKWYKPRPTPLPQWCGVVFNVMVPVSLWAFPILVLIALRSGRYPAETVLVILGIEAALCYAYLIALMPAVQ